MTKKLIILFLLLATPCFGAEISRQNIKPKADYTSDGDTFYMVNMKCAEENTSLSNVKNSKFIRCNIKNCILDDSNTFDRSLYVPEQPEVIEVKTYEELEVEVAELKADIVTKDATIKTLADREVLIAK